jgi:hypothetical protein
MHQDSNFEEKKALFSNKRHVIADENFYNDDYEDDFPQNASAIESKRVF